MVRVRNCKRFLISPLVVSLTNWTSSEIIIIIFGKGIIQLSSERMSQLEKFNRRWVKSEQDLETIRQSELKKQQQIANDHGGLEGIEEFKQETGLKEIVAGFTREGMNVFAQMFSNSVRSAIKEEMSQLSNSNNPTNLPPMFKEVVREVVREELGSVIQYGTEALKELSKGMFNIENINIKPVALQQNEEVVEEEEEEEENVIVEKQDAPSIVNTTTLETMGKTGNIAIDKANAERVRRRSIQMTNRISMLIQVLEDNGGRLKAKEIVVKMQERGCSLSKGTNAYRDITMIVENTDKIERSGYGEYRLVMNKV
jgi:cell division protein FtsB